MQGAFQKISSSALLLGWSLRVVVLYQLNLALFLYSISIIVACNNAAWWWKIKNLDDQVLSEEEQVICAYKQNKLSIWFFRSVFFLVVLFFCIDNKCHLLVFNKEWWKNLFLNLLMKTVTSMEGKLLGKF